MPEFQKDAYGPQDFHEEQLKHYGVKTNRVNEEPAPGAPKQPVQGFEMNEATGMPVPSKSSMPKRKPVGLADPLSAPRKVSPVRPPRPDSPEGMMNKIYRGQDGKFDISTVRREQRSATPPATPSSPLSRPPTPTPRPTPQRTDSTASNASWRSRAGSVGQVARRMSNSFREKVDIIKMNRNERAGYVRRKSSEASTNGKFARDSFDSIQRDSVLDFQTSPAASKPMLGNLSKGEMLALKAAQAIDSIRRGRNGSGDSDMLFSMTDSAPAGAMHLCKRCARATDTFLKDEMCGECYGETKKGKNGK